MTLKCIWRWDSSSGDLAIMKYSFITIAQQVVTFRVPAMGQKDLFKNYSFLIGLCAKKSLKKQLHKKYKYVFTNPSTQAACDKRSTFKQHLTSLKLEFSFSNNSYHSKIKESSLLYYLPIAGFIPFPRALTLCEMQTAWSRSWTQINKFIFNEDIPYTTHVSCIDMNLQWM